jgi:hypothetical protein
MGSSRQPGQCRWAGRDQEGFSQPTKASLAWIGCFYTQQLASVESHRQAKHAAGLASQRANERERSRKCNLRALINAPA